MKKIKFLVVIFLLSASVSFAQSRTVNEQATANSAAIKNMDAPTAVSKSKAQYRRELHAQGLQGKAYRRALHERVHARNVAKKQMQMERREHRAERMHAKNEMKQQRRARAASHGVTPHQAHERRANSGGKQGSRHR